MEEELEAWREVHRHLTQAVLAAREGVAAAKAQRRFWMEEICGNLTPEGKLVQSSVWKRPAPIKARKTPKKSTPKTEKAPPKRKKKKTEGDDEAKPKKKKSSGKRKKKSADDEQDEAGTAEGGKPPKKAKLRLSLKKSGGKPKKKTPKKTNFESDNEDASPSSEQHAVIQNYPDWSAPRQQLTPSPGASAYGMQQAPNLSAAEHFAMMQNVPAELLPFLAPQPAVEPTMAAPPIGVRHSPIQPSMYPNAYASFPQASSDDDSSEED